VYEEPQPTTWDYGLPPGPAAGPQPGSWGYYDEPQRLAPDRADAFWDSFTGPASDPAYGQEAAPPASPPYPPQAAQPAPRPPASHRVVAARPAARRRSGLQGTLVAAVALLVLACGGGAYAIVTSLAGHAGNRGGTGAAGPATSAAARSSPLAPSASPGGARGGASATASPSSPAASAPSGTAPSGTGSGPAGASTKAPAGGGPAPGTTVAVSPGAQADPAEPTVAAWLGRYFTAINAHDYQAYVSLLDSREAANESQSDFTSGFGTTTDSAATLASISDLGGGGEAATVSFTSHQSAARSVNDSSCDRWTITIYLEPGGSSYVLVPPPAGYHSSYESC
jgi:hypothetical protein